MVKIISKTVLAKGQIVIPKTIRGLMGIDVGDELVLDIEDRKIILTKKTDGRNVFLEVCEACSGNISIKEIKKELAARYEGD